MYYLNYYNDTIAPDAVLDFADTGMHRILYVHQGEATVDGTAFLADEAAYSSASTHVHAGSSGARIFRWELGQAPGKVPQNIESMLRMSRECWMLDVEDGTEWLFRLDRINHPAPDAADCHTHPGPGIRALLSGQFRIEQTSENGGGTYPGDPWWETGPEAVISTPMTDEDVHFLRGMLLPVQFINRPDTAVWLRDKPRQKSEWKLYIDEHVKL